ncbi:hypothetical protein FF011L_38900 [Roseimaritima multifibrata]|uniref:Uncharacterized protein n=1 Tax=Roseimaritima multifibrata TaxID=1930274 RepID=A0A517MJM7_9BACT|nr:hypothetical protein FF011L_38900 [Roseimaritima multifibrata]
MDNQLSRPAEPYRSAVMEKSLAQLNHTFACVILTSIAWGTIGCDRIAKISDRNVLVDEDANAMNAPVLGIRPSQFISNGHGFPYHADQRDKELLSTLVCVTVQIESSAPPSSGNLGSCNVNVIRVHNAADSGIRIGNRFLLPIQVHYRVGHQFRLYGEYHYEIPGSSAWYYPAHNCASIFGKKKAEP